MFARAFPRFQARHAFIGGLVLSVLVHLVLLFGPEVELPQFREPKDLPALDAHLTAGKGVEPPASVPIPKPRKAPKPKAQPRETNPAPVVAQPSGADVPPVRATEPAPSPDSTESAAAETVHEQVPEKPFVEPFARLPRRGRLRFDVFWGENRTRIGEATHTWLHDGETYRLQSVMNTTGLAAMLRDVRVAQTSSGGFSDAGFKPREYRQDQSGKSARGESARFDWEAGQATLTSGGERREPLPADTQDLLSLMYQMGGMVGPADAPGRLIQFPVATGRKIEQQTLELVGDETIETGLGFRRTLHLRSTGAAGDARTELWLGLDQHNLPLRIRRTERNGDVVDLLLAELQLDNAGSGAEAPASRP